MTRDKAIEILKTHQGCLRAQNNGECKFNLVPRCEPCKYYTSNEEFNEAESMAIKALEQESASTRKYGVLHKIADFFRNWDGDENAKLEISVKDMREINSMFISKCQAESKLKALEQESCEDCISRLVAIDIASGACHPANVAKELKRLPPVQPKQRVGHWIYELEDWNKWTCSECGWRKRTDVHVRIGYKYCPNCGARMIESQTKSEE